LSHFNNTLILLEEGRRQLKKALQWERRKIPRDCSFREEVRKEKRERDSTMGERDMSDRQDFRSQKGSPARVNVDFQELPGNGSPEHKRNPYP